MTEDHSLNFETDPLNEAQIEELLEEYRQKMESYQTLTKKVRSLERRRIPGAPDEALDFQIQETDKERHERHLKLIEIAERLGKSEADVLIDIIRWENTLAEYGLPEFSIMKSSDIVDTGEMHRAIQFNFSEEPEPLNRMFDNYKVDESSKWGPRKVLDEDDVLLVFAIVPIYNHGETSEFPSDYRERVNRAQMLAEEIEEIGGNFFDEYNGGYHVTSAEIIGVTFPKTEIERVASIIRNNPKKFRLGNEFYDKPGV